MGSVMASRWAKVRAAMSEQGIDVLLLSVGPDLPYLTGYEAMPLERLTMLVVTRDEPAVLVVPRLEAPRVTPHPDLFDIVSWDETDDPVALVLAHAGSPSVAAIGDRTWARFLVELQSTAGPSVSWRRGSSVMGPIRAVKDAAEIAMLQKAGAAADRVAAVLQSGAIPLVGQTEAEVSADLSRRLIDEGHHKVNFAIVATGANAASPHHEPGPTVIQPGDVVLCDFGGTMMGDDGVGYCSDITRCVSLGEPSPEVADAYAVLFEAQAAAVRGAVVGTPCEDVDAIARSIISDAGYGEQFIHRTGHGIGVEEHEDPYIVAGNSTGLEAGHAFSIEPGIYVPGRFGLRLEDIVVATHDGPLACNSVDHSLVVRE